MIEYKQASTENELQQILELQRLNLPKNLTPEEIKNQGFLTVEHNFELLQKMNEACAHTLAVYGEKVVGYALSMHPRFQHEIPILKSMFTKIETVFDGDSFLVMGQICIDKDYRGKGIFRGLYKNMQRFVQNEFEAIITEVDVKNLRSMSAHKAIGFKELSRYNSDKKTWSLIILQQ